MKMRKSLQITGIAGIIIAGAVFGILISSNNPVVTGHAALRNADLADYMATTEYAIVGTVKKVSNPYAVESKYAPRSFVDVDVTVEEDLLGTIDEKEIIIRTHGNILEAVTFNEGEKALLFLVKSTAENVEGAGVYVVSGMYQGKFTITDEVIKDPKYAELTYNKTDILQQIKDQRN